MPAPASITLLMPMMMMLMMRIIPSAFALVGGGGGGGGGGVVDEYCKATGGFDSEAFKHEEYDKKINIFEDAHFFVEHVAMPGGKCGWKCSHCNIFFSGGFHTTKALTHISQSKQADIKPCNGRIEPDRLAMYKKLQAIRSNKRELKAGGRASIGHKVLADQSAGFKALSSMKGSVAESFPV